MKGFKKDKVSKKTAKKIMVALACMMATTLPFSQSVYAADETVGDDAVINNNTHSGDRVFGANGAADVENVDITVDNGGEVLRATGGQSTGGNATNNGVTVKSGATIGIDGVIGGYSKDVADGKAEDNRVTIEGGTISGTVEGGRSTQGTAKGNTVEVTDGDINKAGAVAIMGGNGVKGATGNTVTIHSTGGTNNIKGDVFGGHTSTSSAGLSAGATVDSNTVTIEDGTIAGTIFGAFANNADGVTATGNNVSIAGGTVDASTGSIGPVTGIYGAVSTGDVTGNTVNISGNAAVSGDIDVVGGQSSNANVRGNSVTVGDSATVAGTVYGGKSGLATEGQAIGNIVDITGGTITAKGGESAAVIGGWAAGLVEGNEVTIGSATIRNNGTDNGNVSGGSSETLANRNSVTLKTGSNVADDVNGGSSNKDATNNVVLMEAGQVGGDIRGGFAQENATSNKLTIKDGMVSGKVAGGRTDGSYGFSASNNELRMTGGTVGAAAAGYAAGGGNVTNNRLYMTGGTVDGSGMTDGVAAGYTVSGNAEGNELYFDGGNVTSIGGVSGGASGLGQSTGNSLTMTGGTVNKSAQGGYSQYGDATDNTFKLSGGTVGKHAYGAYSENGGADSNTLEVSGGTMTNAVGGRGNTSANDNTVKITGGKINNNIFGGNAYDAGGTATGNQIFISGAPTLSGSTNISAGRVNSVDQIAAGSNNNVYLGYADQNTTAALTKAMNVDTIAGENVYLGAFGGEAVTAGESGAAITAKNVKANSINLSKVALDRVVGEDFTILEATDNLDVATVTDGTVTMGSTVQQQVGLDGNRIGLKPGTRTVQAQTSHALLNAQAGVAALAAGNTLIERATTGLEADGFTGENPQEWRAFAYVGGGKAEYDTGSSVTTNTWNGMVGVGRHDKRKDGGALTYGLFYEYGNGNYSTDDSDGRGDGDARYNGGGLLAKNETGNGFYYEGSFRAGRMKNDANNILRVGSKTYGYSEDSNYWGFHLGVGKVLKFNGDRSLDVYGKYFYNHLDGVSFDAAGHYDLDDVKTSLLRLGARYNFLKRAGWTSYGGFAYEYEFGGEAGGFADGFAIRKADLGGSSVLFELGMKLQPDEKSPWGLDLNFTAHAGQRKGVMGGATVSYAF